MFPCQLLFTANSKTGNRVSQSSSSVHTVPQHVLQHSVHSLRLSVCRWVIRSQFAMHSSNSLADSVGRLVAVLSATIRDELQRHAMRVDHSLHEQTNLALASESLSKGSKCTNFVSLSTTTQTAVCPDVVLGKFSEAPAAAQACQQAAFVNLCFFDRLPNLPQSQQSLCSQATNSISARF